MCGGNWMITAHWPLSRHPLTNTLGWSSCEFGGKRECKALHVLPPLRYRSGRSCCGPDLWGGSQCDPDSAWVPPGESSCPSGGVWGDWPRCWHTGLRPQADRGTRVRTCWYHRSENEWPNEFPDGFSEITHKMNESVESILFCCNTARVC